MGSPPIGACPKLGNNGFGLELQPAMAITKETRPMKCVNCGADSATGDQTSGPSASVCPECGCVLGSSDETHENRGFLTRLSRFGLGAKHRPLFQDHRKEQSK